MAAADRGSPNGSGAGGESLPKLGGAGFPDRLLSLVRRCGTDLMTVRRKRYSAEFKAKMAMQACWRHLHDQESSTRLGSPVSFGRLIA